MAWIDKPKGATKWSNKSTLPGIGKGKALLSKEEEELVEMDCLFDDNDEEVQDTRAKKNTYLDKKDAPWFQGFAINVDAMFDGWMRRYKEWRAANKERAQVEEAGSKEGQQFIREWGEFLYEVKRGGGGWGLA